MNTSIPIPGCRHDILGHNLKAIGLLRVLAICADAEYRDPEAEGWWDLESACFRLRSEKYPNEAKLLEFFAQRYRPTPIFSPWNTGGGLDEKQEIVVTFSKLKTGKKGDSKPGKPTKEETDRLIDFISQNKLAFQAAGLDTQNKIAALRKKKPSAGEFSFVLNGDIEPIFTKAVDGVTTQTQVKASSKKDVVAILERDYGHLGDVAQGIKINRLFFDKFKDTESLSARRVVFESLRDLLSEQSATALDAILTARTGRVDDNPLFLNRGKGEGGNDELFRTFWNYFLTYKKHPNEYADQSLFGRDTLGQLPNKDTEGKGTPFFPDAIKTYNNGLAWVADTFPFNALDYLLAVEGALALRGAASRALAANSRRYAAFPFVFDSGEDFVDENNEVKRTASSIWLPLWNRPATFLEVSSFICDAQARLPGKEARFSAEFARALRVQGVDAGFSGWQEFRFKMKASKVPWVCTGRYLGATSDPHSIRMNDALAPLDESGFLDQFEVWRDKRDRKIKNSSPHYIRADLNEAIERTVTEATPENALGILLRVFAACRQLTDSKSLREKIAETGERVTFFEALPMAHWEKLLQGLEHLPEFRIARALASITGLAKQQKQSNGKAVFSDVQPLLGSLLPLKRGPRGWYHPTESKDRSKQAVWTGADLGHDIARVMSRRYLDSLDDERPALMSPRPAPLEDVLAFLNDELDDHRIARWTEALSLIGWHFEKQEESADPSASSEEQPLEDEQRQFPAVPLAYAALRSVIEMECAWQGNDISLWKKRRSHRPIALLCQRTSSSLALAVEDALRWLAIWGVPNCWGEAARREESHLGGRDIIRADHRKLNFGETRSRFVSRLAAAVLIPLDWRDRGKLYRAVTLPQSVEH